MAFPFLEVAGLAAGLGSSLLASSEARKRFHAMRKAAQRLQRRQDNEFNTAYSGLRSAQASWESDPAQATVRQMWEQRLAHPDVISDAELSTEKQGALSEAGSESAGAINALREQAARSGLGGSKMALGAEAGLRSQAFGKAAALSSGLDLTAKKANQASEDSVRSGYADYAAQQNDTRTNYAQMLANLLGNRQYGESALLAYS
jgi:hypothetical protein